MFYIYANGIAIYKPLDENYVVFSPKCTLEIGKAGSVEFDIPPSNPYYNKLDQLSTLITVDIDDEEIFRGRVLSNEKSFNNVRHVYCEGDLSYLVDSVQKGVYYNGNTHDLFRQIIAKHNSRVEAKKQFTVGTINIENRPVLLYGKSQSEDGESLNVDIDYKQIALDSIVDEWNNTYDYIQDVLIDYCGGYLRTRRVGNTTYIDLLSDFGTTASQEIRLGSNLLDLKEEISAENIFTVLIPLGDENLTIASVNGGSDELVDRDAVAKYGRIVQTHVFSNVTSPHTLLEDGLRYLASNVNIPRTITVRAVDLSMLNSGVQPIKIGDIVTVESMVHDVDDELLCTKIEYDMEHPENNTYTFGNPKQSLTQRYREDLRKDASSASNASAVSASGAASPASASAASAGAAAQAAKKDEEEERLKEFDAYIKTDPSTGTITMQALHNMIVDGKEVLKSQCGIDLDGDPGNVNIHSLYKQVDENNKILAVNTANIKIIEEDTKVQIQNTTERVEQLATGEAEHYTELLQKSSSLGSQISMLAKDITKTEDSVNSSLADLMLRADNTEANVTATARYVQEVNGQITEKVAQIIARADAISSEIELKADKVSLAGQLSGITAYFDGRATAKSFRATDIIAGSIKLFGEGGAVEVATYNHSHQFVIRAADNGTVQVNLGRAVSTIPQVQSFNIADTKFYKDGVSAVSVTSLAYYKLSGEETVTWDESSKSLKVSVQATLSNGNTNGSIRTVVVPATLAYEAGKKAGGVAGNVASLEQTSKISNNGQYYTVTAVAKDEHGEKLLTVTYDTDNESYTNGINSTTITTLALNRASGSDPGWVYDTDHHRYTVNVKTIISNGKSRTASFTIDASSQYQAAYNEGAAGIAEVKVNSMQLYQVSGEETVSYSEADNTLTASIQATLSNGNTNGSVRSVTIPATLAYNAGAQSVKASTIGRSGTPTYQYNNGSPRYLHPLRTVLSNGKAFTVSTFYVDASAAFNDGRDRVSTTGIAYYTQSGESTVTYNSTNKTLSASVQATLSNNNTSGSIRTVTIPADLAYNDGVTSGEANVTISRIAITSGGTITYETANNRFKVPITATASNTKSVESYVYVPAADAYNAGQTAGVNSVTATAPTLDTSGGSTYQSANKRYAVSVYSNASNGSKKSGTIYVGASDAFNAGQTAGVSSVTATAPTLDTSGGSTYQSANKRYAVSVYSNASNGSKKSGTIYVGASDAYDAGKTEGVNSVTATAPTLDTSGGSTYQTSNNRYAVSVYSNASNGSKKSGTIYVGASDAYDAGQTAGVNSVTATAPTLDTSGGSTYQSANKRYAVSVYSNASNGSKKSGTIYVGASDAYNAGKTEGANSVTATAPTLDTSGGSTYQSANNRYAVSVYSNASNGSKKSGTIYVGASDAYNAGYTAGQNASTVTVDSGRITNYSFNSYYGTYDMTASISLSNGDSDDVSLSVSVGDAINYGKTLVDAGYTNIYPGFDLLTWYQTGGDVTGFKARIYVYGTKNGYNQQIGYWDVEKSRY